MLLTRCETIYKQTNLSDNRIRHSSKILWPCEYVVSDMERCSLSTGVRKSGKHSRCADRREMTIYVKKRYTPNYWWVFHLMIRSVLRFAFFFTLIAYNFHCICKVMYMEVGGFYKRNFSCKLEVLCSRILSTLYNSLLLLVMLSKPASNYRQPLTIQMLLGKGRFASTLNSLTRYWPGTNSYSRVNRGHPVSVANFASSWRSFLVQINLVEDRLQVCALLCGHTEHTRISPTNGMNVTQLLKEEIDFRVSVHRSLLGMLSMTSKKIFCLCLQNEMLYHNPSMHEKMEELLKGHFLEH